MYLFYSSPEEMFIGSREREEDGGGRETSVSCLPDERPTGDRTCNLLVHETPLQLTAIWPRLFFFFFCL